MSLYQHLCALSIDDEKRFFTSLGYGTTQKGLCKWHQFLESHSLENFLEHENYDLVHTNDSFARALCDYCALSCVEIEQIQERKKEQMLALERIKQPYIFVNTQFHRQSEPLIALACLEHLRRLNIDKRCVLESNDDGLAHAQKTILDYQAKMKGKLPLWGEIHHYEYYVNEQCFMIDTNGKLIEDEIQKSDNSCAFMVVR